VRGTLRVMLYSRAQLRLLLVLAAILLVGLGVREWRAGFPDTASRLERFDHPEPLAPLVAAARGESGAPPSDTPAKGARASGSTPRPEPREAPPPVADPRPLDLNRATVAELARLPGVGPGLAQRIFEERERRGRFDSPDALRTIMGVGPKKLAALRDLVTIGE
jgi:competence ComEA-like helix-hairpin-helix protein